MAVSTLDPYATLGIPAGTSRSEAARAHRRLAKRYHPDLNRGPEAVERMRRINEAWRILSDPARRARYDAERSMSRAGGTSRPTRGPVTWAPWPESRRTAAPRRRRPARVVPAEPSFGDRPVVIVAVWMLLSLLYFVGAWLGSLTP